MGHENFTNRKFSARIMDENCVIKEFIYFSLSFALKRVTPVINNFSKFHIIWVSVYARHAKTVRQP